MGRVLGGTMRWRDTSEWGNGRILVLVCLMEILQTCCAGGELCFEMHDVQMSR